jgi:hypothetical protein
MKERRNSKVQKNNNSTDEKQKKNLCEQVMFCLQPAVRSNITVFNLNSDNDLSETIFRCISKCKSYHFLYFDPYSSVYVAYQKLWNKKKNETPDRSNDVQFDSKGKEQIERELLLQLAMDWDYIDIAKDFVFENSFENITVYIFI